MYSIIIPVYRNEETIIPLIESLEGLAARLSDPLEVVFVVDASPDRCYEILQQSLPRVSFSSQLLLFTRNFGSFAGVRVGLGAAQGPLFAVMAADLQEPTELMFEFHQALTTDEIDIALGERSARNDPLLTRLSANLFWWFYCRFVQPEMQSGGVDTFGCTEQVRDALLKLEESNSSLVGQLIWLGFRRKSIPYVRQERAAGKSAWTLKKKVNYMSNSIFSFTAMPIALLGVIGFVGVISSIIIGATVFSGWLAGLIDVRGYTPLMLMIVLSTSANLLGLSVVGGYIWRTFENSKRRPESVVLRQDSFPAAAKRAA